MFEKLNPPTQFHGVDRVTIYTTDVFTCKVSDGLGARGFWAGSGRMTGSYVDRVETRKNFLNQNLNQSE